VKTVVIRDSTPSNGSLVCVAALEARLAEKGFTVVETSDGADAEVTMTLAFAQWRVWSNAFNRPANLTYVVTAKTLPDHRHVLSLERLGQYEAVRLFIERAQAVNADFTVTNGPAGSLTGSSPRVSMDAAGGGTTLTAAPKLVTA
jgi:hypothetical protein